MFITSSFCLLISNISSLVKSRLSMDDRSIFSFLACNLVKEVASFCMRVGARVDKVKPFDS